MAQTVIRNGKKYVLPDDFTEEQINKEIDRQTSNPIPQPEQVKEKEKEDTRSFITDIPLQVVGGFRDAGQSMISLFENLRETSVGGFVVGDDARNGIVEYLNPEELRERGFRNPITGKVGERDAFKLPEVDKPETVLGTITRGISQFYGGWVTAPAKFAKSGFTGTLARGAQADFLAFDEDTGRVVDIITELAPSLENPIFDYLSAKKNEETWYEGRLKNALEGGMIGTALTGIVKAAPVIKVGAEKVTDTVSEVKDKIFDLVQFIKLRRLEADGKPIDLDKIKELEDKVTGQNIVLTGKGGTKNLAENILKDAQTTRTAERFETLKDKAGADELNEEIVKTFDRYMDSVRANATNNANPTMDWKKLSESLDFKFSPRAYADTDFGIIMIEALQKAVLADRKFDKIGNKIIELQAQKVGGDILQVTKMVGQLGNKLEEGLKYMWASQAIQQNLADALYKMANSIAKNEKTYSIEQAKITTALLGRLIDFDSKVASNLGRGLNLRGVLKDANVDLSRDSILNQIKAFANFGGNFEDFLSNVAKVKDVSMLSKVTNFVFNNRFWNAANEVWMSAALSLPKTHIINAISAATNLILKPVSLMAGSKLTWGLDPALAKEVTQQMDTGASILAGYKSYLSDSIKFMKKAFADEDSVLFGGSTKFDANTKALGSKYAPLIRIPLRALTAGDEFFKQTAYRSRLTQIAVREAQLANKSRDKVVGTLPDGRTYSEFDEYVANRFKQGFDETGLIGIDAEAKRFAGEVTFTKDLTGILRLAQELVNEAPIFKQVLPFVKTPANIALQAIEMTPLSLLSKETRANFTGSSRDAFKIAETRGRLAVGSTILGLTSLYSLTGNIRGGFHPDREIREQQQSQGYLPYSVKIPFTGTWIQYGRLDPIAMLLGTVADYTQIYPDLNDKDREKIEYSLLQHMNNVMGKGSEDTLPSSVKIQNMIIGGYKSVFSNIASKTYLRGLIDFLQSFDGDDVERRGGWWVQNKLSSYMPNILTKVSNDPYLRDTQTFVEELRNRVGDRTLPKKYNYLGEPIVDDRNAIWRLFNKGVNPFEIKTTKDDPVLRDTVENEINIPPLKKVKDGVDLTQFVNKNGETAYEVYNNKLANSSLRKNLESLIKTKEYKNLPTQLIYDENNKFGGKKVLVYRQVQEARDLAFDLLLAEGGNFKSIHDSRRNLSDAFVNRTIIQDLGTNVNVLPKKTNIYKFLDQVR